MLYVGVDLTDKHFLQTHFTWSTADIKAHVQYIVKLAETFAKASEDASKDILNEINDELQGFFESLKKGQPDFKEVISSYKNQLNELKEELQNDEGFKEASENVKKVIQAISKVVLEVSKKVTELADCTLELFTKMSTAVQEIISKTLPKLKELYIKLVEVFNKSVVTGVLDFASSVIRITANFVKEHEDEIKKFVEMVKDFTEDAGKVIGSTVIQVRNEIVAYVKLLLNQVEALPAYTTLKQQYQLFLNQLKQYLVPEQTWSVIKEVIGPFKDTLPTPELREFLSATEDYIEKHLEKDEVYNAEELQALINKAVKALKSLVTLITDHLPKGDPTKEASSFLGIRPPVALKALFELPRVVALRYSPLHFLTSGNLQELPTLQEFLHTFKPSFNPKDWVPPYRAHGADVVDGNFSVALDYETKSLIISDRHDTVVLFPDSKLKVNGEASEYPYEGGDFIAFKDFGAVNVMHKAGLYVKCDTHYSKPNGQVVSDVNEFGNSWKVNPSCGDASGPSHHDHHMAEPPECANLFGGSTPLKLGYLLTPVAPYREACTHIVADSPTPDAKKQAACATAAAYVTNARSYYFPVYLPSECDIHPSAMFRQKYELHIVVYFKNTIGSNIKSRMQIH
ncbi:hypothetical protein L9F63_018708 [Diploptera punctata]|uniref:Uncharacterized protein n=1 Tax=Diploptera punctata TaxID=6984 RepID=A0AAD7ZWT4_DIPPU|nr:hypothetical protein L9F63_018708 [Diploptera punctata]